MQVIDVDVLKDSFKLRINWLKRKVHDQYSLGLYHEAEYGARVISKISVIEAEPIRHGRWIDCSNGWMCSVCGQDNTYDKPYCPNCGAKMDLKGDRSDV